MPYQSVFTTTFEKHLKRIKKSGKWEQVRKKIEDIIERPDRVGEDKGQILKGCRATKMGHHVIVWKVVRETIYFLACDEHDDAYLAAQKEARERWKSD